MLDTILLCESSTPAHAPTPAQQMQFLENALRSSQWVQTCVPNSVIYSDANQSEYLVLIFPPTPW